MLDRETELEYYKFRDEFDKLSINTSTYGNKFATCYIQECRSSKLSRLEIALRLIKAQIKVINELKEANNEVTNG